MDIKIEEHYKVNIFQYILNKQDIRLQNIIKHSDLNNINNNKLNNFHII